ncbi:unnamed protein product [Bursaphelenchus xylophilus]|uniref:(pine wood nematode) hypothetical protein n=1 Tax=Bursaphelenchus xylophilus TaxID=6326 RepID=A0A1I7SDL7_BURXY|nr:unnamed protein product [Bursaphelenchus xylophilus]CAG9120853.1 unnamed protein product [Bursaphelenchus xylophilus]
MRLSLALFVAILALSEARRSYESDDSSHEADARNRSHADKQLKVDGSGHKSLKQNKTASASKSHKDADAHKKFVEGPNGYSLAESSNLNQAADNSDSQSSLELVQGPDGFSKSQSSDESSSSSSSKKSHSSKVIVDGEGGANFGGYGSSQSDGQYGGFQYSSEYGASQFGDRLGQYGSEAAYGQSGYKTGQVSGENVNEQQKGQGGLYGPRPLPLGEDEDDEHNPAHSGYETVNPRDHHKPPHQPLEEEHNPVHAGNEEFRPEPFPYGESEEGEHSAVHPGYEPEDNHENRRPKDQPLEDEHSPVHAGNDEYGYPAENGPAPSPDVSKDQVFTNDPAGSPDKQVSQGEGRNDGDDSIIIEIFLPKPSEPNDQHPEDEHYPVYSEHEENEPPHHDDHSNFDPQLNPLAYITVYYQPPVPLTPKRSVSQGGRSLVGQRIDDDQGNQKIQDELLPEHPQPLPVNEEDQYPSRPPFEPFMSYPASILTPSPRPTIILGPPTYFTTARPAILVDPLRTTSVPRPQVSPRIGTAILGPRLPVAAGNKGQTLEGEPRVEKVPSVSAKVRHGGYDELNDSPANSKKVFDGTQTNEPRVPVQPFASVPVRQRGYSAIDELDDSSANSKKHTHNKNELIKGPGGQKKASSLDNNNQSEASKVHKKSVIRADRHGKYSKSAEESGSNASAQNHVKANNLEEVGPNGYLKKNEVDQGTASKANKFDKKSNMERNADGSFSSSQEEDSSSASQEKSHKAKSIVMEYK